MKLNKLADNLLLFTFDTRKEITLTFFRVEEFYESPLPKLVGQRFSVFDFLNESMNDDGEINYFSYWSGFNIPGDVIRKWWETQDVEQVTPKEIELMNNIQLYVDVSKPYYVIGAMEKDKDVINHEIAHALYYLNTDYQYEMNNLIMELLSEHTDTYYQIKNSLLEMGYNAKVVDDEIQAYLSSEKKRYLIKNFGIDYTPVSGIIKKFKKTLQKYNVYHV